MLTTNFDKMFDLRGIKNPYTYLLQNGFSRTVAWRICQNDFVKLDLFYLEKLCLLLHCTPHDVLEWIPDSNPQDNEQQPLNNLKPKKKSNRLSKLIDQFPVDKIEELEKAIEEIKNKKTS